MIFIPKFLMTVLVMVSLSLLSLSAIAAPSDATATGEQSQTERFNHMTTGFVLTGAHAIAECGSCHVGGVFKGTRRNCNGCHTKGQRVVATAMSSTHIVTTEPCEVCHTNTVTFLGARFNHGKAIPGQCANCHNGLSATGRASSHRTGSKLTKSCDSCHRSTAWLPASWNHFGNTAKCVTCHVTGGDGAAFVRTNVGGTTPEHFAHAYTTVYDCEGCHSSYNTWYGALYNHSTSYSGGTCVSCHDGVKATGTAQKSGHVAIGTDDCSSCHTTKITWLGALGGKPANHIPYDAGVSCGSCHVGTAKVARSTLHAYSSTSTCATCHISPNAYTGSPNAQKTKSSHKGSSGNNCSSCHPGASSYSNWGD